MTPQEIVIKYINKVYKNGLTTTSGGNLSVKDAEGNIYITPSGKDKGTLVAEDICKVTPTGEVIGKFAPSIELPFHSLIYKLRPEINAVLHVHSPKIVSYTLINQVPEIQISAHNFNTCGKIGFSLYDIPGSIDLGNQIAKFIAKGYDSVLMQNHGVVFVADTMSNAYDRLETLENTANICLKARLLGKIKTLSTFSKPKITSFEPYLLTAEETQVAKQIALFTNRCYEHKYFLTNLGCISCRVGENILITPAEYDRSDFDYTQICVIKNGKCYNNSPDYDFKKHLDIYNKSKTNCIFASSPANIMAYAVTDSVLNSRILPESYINMRDVIFADTEDDIASLSEKTPVAIVRNKGAYTIGNTMIKAFDRLEVTEVTAGTLIDAKVLGDVYPISETEINKIICTFKLEK
ncbi:MAG: class II aldolase/adducin family protein [Clostridia bacterium]